MTWVALGVAFAGKAGHWFITPMNHPNASSLKSVLVGAQLVLGLGLLAYAARVERRARDDEREVAEITGNHG
jgi:hypothetical protein